MIDNKKIILTEPMYLPPVSFFKSIKNCKRLHIDVHQYYQKSTYRNRMILPSANGLLTLSVPLSKGKNQKMPMCDVKISYQTDWQKNHFKTISVIYKKSPFFEFYENELKEIYQIKYEKLIDWNLKLLEFALKSLQIKIEISFTEKYEINHPFFFDLRNFDEKKIYENPIFYHQVFEDKIGFQPYVSILDLIFNEGNNAYSFI
jgi:WbqC-like protein family